MGRDILNTRRKWDGDIKIDHLGNRQRVGLGMWSVWVWRGGCIGSWLGNRRERDHWGDLGVVGCIILGRISSRWDVGLWTGLGWPLIETGGGRLWVR